MKIHFFVWACLALFCQNATANSHPTETKKEEKENSEIATTDKVVELIPGRELTLTVNDKKDKLKVTLTGEAEDLEWIIFQPKGEVLKRISSKSKFDEIKIGNLKDGKYVLMIKDVSGRMLFRSFEK